MTEVGFEHPLAIISVLISLITVAILLRVAQQLRARQAKHQGPAWTVAEPQLSKANNSDFTIPVHPATQQSPWPASRTGGEPESTNVLGLGLLPEAARSSQIGMIPASLPLPVVVQAIQEQDVLDHSPVPPAALGEMEQIPQQPPTLEHHQPLSSEPLSQSQPTDQQVSACVPAAALPLEDAPSQMEQGSAGVEGSQESHV